MAGSRELRIVISGDAKGAIKAFNDTEAGASRLDRGISVSLNAVVKAAKWAGAAITAALGYSLWKGFDRLGNIEDAQAKLKGLGHDAQSVEQIMSDALASVKGTAYGLDTAATVAATAVAAGIKPGKDLERYLRLTADAASISGASMDELGNVMNNVTTIGAAYNDSLQILAQKGLPIYTWLAQEMGVTEAAVKDLASQGKISSELFQAAIEKNIGGAALASGDTTRGAFANMQAAAGRFGAAVLGGVFPNVKTAFAGITSYIDQVTPAAEKAAEAISKWLGEALVAIGKWWDKNGPGIVSAAISIGQALLWVGEKAKSGAEFVIRNWERIGPLLKGVIATAVSYLTLQWIASGIAASVAAAKNVAAWVSVQAAAIKSGVATAQLNLMYLHGWARNAAAATAGAAKVAAGWVLSGASAAAAAVRVGASVAVMVAGWVLLGAQSLLHAAKVAAAWLIAMGPIGLIIAAVIGVVALIVANWDTIARVTGELWEKVKQWTGAAWEWVKNAIGTALEFVKNLFLNFTGPGLIIKHWETIKAATGAAFEWVKNTIRSILDTIAGWLSAPFKFLFDLGPVQDAIDKINDLGDAINRVTPSLPKRPAVVTDKDEVKRIIEGRRAAGGPVSAGRQYLVGEEGPELVVPRHHGTVIPADLTSDMIGGQSITNNITVNGSDASARDISREIAWLLKTT